MRILGSMPVVADVAPALAGAVRLGQPVFFFNEKLRITDNYYYNKLM